MSIKTLCLTTLAAGLSTLMAQSPDLAGTWRLVTCSAKLDSGERIANPYGPNPKGFLTYTRDGRMSAILSYGGRKPLSTADRLLSSPEEQASAFATFFAYAGRYTIQSGRVTHHVEIASVENWVNTDLVRSLKLEGDRLTLTTPPTPVGGKMQTTELVWERVR